MYVIFKDLTSFEYYIISMNSIEYPDYDTMANEGYMSKTFNGTKKQCQEKLEEIEI